jgi:hypothetical protein
MNGQIISVLCENIRNLIKRFTGDISVNTLGVRQITSGMLQKVRDACY